MIKNSKQVKMEEMLKKEKEAETAEAIEKEEQEQEPVSEPTLEEIIGTITQERDEMKDRYLRTLAEFENYRVKMARDKEEWIKYAAEKVLIEVCDIYDNFERAVATEVNESNITSFVDGVNLICKQMEALLKKHDIQKIEAIGEVFDPQYHEALAHIPSEQEEGTIAAVIQNGYKLKEKVIRPVRVAVSKGQETKE